MAAAEEGTRKTRIQPATTAGEDEGHVHHPGTRIVFGQEIMVEAKTARTAVKIFQSQL